LYAYISRIEANARTPSVKAMRKLARKLGVTVEYLETGKASATELGHSDAGLAFDSLTDDELHLIEGAVDEAARDAARRASEQVIEDRWEAERQTLRARLQELDG
jgi:transcriptional regulator with XRE-family HTH domain